MATIMTADNCNDMLQENKKHEKDVRMACKIMQTRWEHSVSVAVTVLHY